MSKNKKIQEEVSKIMGISPSLINKYTIVTALFIVWVTFFDKHNIFAYQKLKGMVTQMELEKERLNDEIAQTLIDKKDLELDHEKFAREKHLMHLSDEEIILIEKKKK